MAAIAASLALSSASPALGSATPLSPPPGGVVASSHPLFTWSLPPNEESDGIYVASAPQTTPEGEFFSENVVDLGVFFSDERQWAPTSP